MEAGDADTPLTITVNPDGGTVVTFTPSNKDEDPSAKFRRWSRSLRTFIWGFYMLLFITMFWNCCSWKDVILNVFTLTLVNTVEYIASDKCSPDPDANSESTTFVKKLRFYIASTSWIFVNLIAILIFLISYGIISNIENPLEGKSAFDIIPCNVLPYYAISMFLIEIIAVLGILRVFIGFGMKLANGLVTLTQAHTCGTISSILFGLSTPISTFGSGYFLYRMGYGDESLLGRLSLTLIVSFWGVAYIPIVLRKGLNIILPISGFLTGLLFTLGGISVALHFYIVNALRSTRDLPNLKHELVPFILSPNPFNVTAWTVYLERPDVFYFGNDSAVWLACLGLHLLFTISAWLISSQNKIAVTRNATTGGTVGCCLLGALPYTLAGACCFVIPMNLAAFPGVGTCTSESCSCPKFVGAAEQRSGSNPASSHFPWPVPTSTRCESNPYKPSNGGHPWHIQTNQHGATYPL